VDKLSTANATDDQGIPRALPSKMQFTVELKTFLRKDMASPRPADSNAVAQCLDRC